MNGAGLAMATMDIIKLHGGEPANFLDGLFTFLFELLKEILHNNFQLVVEQPWSK